MKNVFFVIRGFFVALFCALGFFAGSAGAFQSDNGDGTYSNPVLYADYPDPDICRVGNDFYMVSTTFADSPGVNVLHSKDLVNWEIISHLATNLDGGNSYNMIGGTAYRGGFWASTIKYYNGTFYVIANPVYSNSRIYYTTNIAGPWQYFQLNQSTYDAGLFIDTDGKGYIVAGHGPQSVYVLSSDYSQIVTVSNNVLNSGGEGSHVVKRGNYYYVFNAKPTVWPYQLLCSRATNIFGPYETNHVCLTETTGGHQGSIVDMPDGTDYGFVMRDGGAIGRMTYICPVTWSGGWPVWGSSGVPTKATKPIQGMPVMQPGTSDDFTNSTLGLHWQWNHNPDNARWSLAARPGYLRLAPTPANNFWLARNTLTQKGQGPWSRGEVKLDVSHMQPGDVCGFGTLGLTNGQIAVTCDNNGTKYLRMSVIVPTNSAGAVYQTNYGRVAVTGTNVYLRVDMDFLGSLGTCSYSFDGVTWSTLGGQFGLGFDISVATFQGEKFAIFCYNPTPGSGYVDVDYFHFSDKIRRGRPHMNAARTTLVADNGQPLRGPFTSTEWTSASPSNQIANIRNLGFNAVHLYAESFTTNYPAGTSSPGYNAAQVDKIVQSTRDSGLYLVITIGNGSYNGNYNLQWVTDFWKFYAARYANETHVLYEIQNEPVAWGPPYLTSQNPPGAVDMEIAAYKTIRAVAPNTPVLLFTYAVFGDTGGANAALTDIHAFNKSVFGTSDVVWTNEVVGFHGYAGWQGATTAVGALISAGYPCFMTEFATSQWGSNLGGFDAEMVVELERRGVSWLTFQYIPPTGVSDDVTQPSRFSDVVNKSGLSWNPDYGNWPQARGVFGNNGVAWATPGWANNVLSGTLRVEAENFDNGGNGIAYYNTNSSVASKYRTNDTVNIETSVDTGGGYDVTSTAGDWLEYTIRVGAAGMYDLRMRVASVNGANVQALSSGTALTGTVAVPATGGGQTWRTITNSVLLGPGQQKLRISALSGGFSLNWIELSPASSGAIANGTYKFLNCGNGLSLQGTNGNVIASAYAGTKDQQWTITHIGGDEYRVSSAANLGNWSAGSGQLSYVGWWGAGNNQCFILLPTSGGYYRVVPVGSGMALQTSATNSAVTDQKPYAGSSVQQWAIVAPTIPGFPTGLSAVSPSSSLVNLTWNPVNGASSYNVKRSATSGGPYSTIASVTTTNYTDTISAGAKYYYVVSAVVGGVEGLISGEASVKLPYPWTSQDIGAVGIPGSASYSNAVFAVTASGSDIWNTSDLFRFVYVPMTGDCTIIARVTSVQNTDPWSKAGVMIRESLAANSTYAFIAVTPGNGVSFQYRSSTGGNSSNNNSTGYTAPYWVKLVRSGNTFAGYRSSDGVNWTQQGSTVTISMASTVYAGLAVTSHNNSSSCVATFDNVSLPNWSAGTPPSAPVSLNAAGSGGQVVLTWSASSGATSYNVKRSATDGGPYTVLFNVSATSYTDTGLVTGATYYYVVTAVNAAGESGNSPQTSATLLANMPTGLAAVATSTNQINLTWKSVANASSYNVKRSSSSGGSFVIIGRGVTTTNYVDSGLAFGTLYYYVVSAVVGGNETADSAQASAATLSPVIGSLVHRYPFTETTGTTVTDSVGGPVWNGTLPAGATLMGNYMTLSGSQYVSLPTGVVGSVSNATLMTWVNLSSSSNWCRIFDFGNDTTNYMFLTPNSGNGMLRFAITTNGGAGEQKIDGTSPLTTGAWHQVAVVLNSGTGILYVDGVAAGTNATMTLNPSSLGVTSNNFVGKSQYSDPYLNGSIAQFRIYNVGLSAAEIAATAALGAGRQLSTDSPLISATVNGDDLTLSWPLAWAGFTLQSTTNLGSRGWTNVTTPTPQIVGSQWQVTLPLTSDAVFFQLTK